MIGVDYPCSICTHRHKELADGWKAACDAYPDGIPSDIILKAKEEDLTDCGGGFCYEEDGEIKRLLNNSAVRR